MIFLLSILFLSPSITRAQERVEAPIWNVGHKWVFTQGNIEVVRADQNGYTLNLSKDICFVENKYLEKIILDKSTLNRIFILKGDERVKYTILHRRILNFPLNLGKEWKDSSIAKALSGPKRGSMVDFAETFKVLGWENVEVQAGNFKTIKLDYTQENRNSGYSGKAIYWYAPEVKYFVKCQYDKRFFEGASDWELASFKLK